MGVGVMGVGVMGVGVMGVGEMALTPSIISQVAKYNENQVPLVYTCSCWHEICSIHINLMKREAR